MKLEDLLHSNHKRRIDWCDLEGMASNPAAQKRFNFNSKDTDSALKLSAKDIIFRDPKKFVAGQLRELTMNFGIWLCKGYYKQDEILKHTLQGVSVYDFISPFKGPFKGKCYNSKLFPVSMFPNSESCEAFEDFISNSILERVANGFL